MLFASIHIKKSFVTPKLKIENIQFILLILSLGVTKEKENIFIYIEANNISWFHPA